MVSHCAAAIRLIVHLDQGDNGDTMQQRAVKSYFQTQVTTTSQGDLVVMLYDGAIKFLNQAKVYLAANDMAKKGLAISKALDVINELDSSLNMEKGGELSNNLHGLYAFCTNQLVMANLKKDPERIDHVLKVLTGIRSAYAEIASLPEAQAAAQEAASNLHANAILPPRAQAGTSPSGAAAPVPGAGIRARAVYAQSGRPQPSDGEDSPVSDAQADADSSPMNIAQETPAEPAKTAAPGPAGASQPEEALPPPPSGHGFGTPGGFARRAAGAEMYRKFSG